MRTAPKSAAYSLQDAADFLATAAAMVADGARADCPVVAQLVDFGKRKAWQGEQELAGRRFRFRM